jgi:nucleoporin POM152
MVDQFTIHSIQNRARLELFTSVAGQLQYHVSRLGDSSYPLRKQHEVDTISNRATWLTFRQSILRRPRAFFKAQERLTFCLYDSFRTEDMDANSGVISLHGTSPFYLELSLHNLATGETRKERVKLLQEEWRVELPDYRFQTVGSYMLMIDSVWDASGCEQEAELSGFRTLLIDVAETAAIVPLERREDYCVGDMLRFQLEGWVQCTCLYRNLCLLNLRY